MNQIQPFDRYDATVGQHATAPDKSQGEKEGPEWINLGGSNVLIDDGGLILEGCPGLKGTNIADLDETRDYREAKQEAADKAGLTGRDIDLDETDEFDGDWSHVTEEGGGTSQDPREIGYHEPTDPEWDEPEEKTEPLTTEARHAQATEALEGAPDSAVKQFFKGLLGMRDVRKQGAGETTEMHPDHVQRIHDALTSMGQAGDGFGDVYDLSAQLGAGAVGYHSPAGMFTLQPPTSKEGDWTVRASLPSVEEPVGEPIDSGPTDEPQQEVSQEKPEEVAPRVTPHLQRAMQAMGFEDPRQEEMFAHAANEAWQMETDRRQELNEMIRAVNQQFGSDRGGALTRQLRQTADAQTQVSRFDEVAEFVQNQYPGLLAHYGGKFGVNDPEFVAAEMLKLGQQKMPAVHHPEILQDALELLANWEQAQDYQPDERTEEISRAAMERGEAFARKEDPYFWRELYARLYI